jgi:acyl dehydratase
MLDQLKAVAPIIPGASKLPWVAGGGGEMPDLERRCEGVEVDRAHLAAYDRVCGFRVRDELPATYPHILAFKMQMDLMTDGRFPFATLGMVHIGNRITVHRAIRAGETLDFVVRASEVRPHTKGKVFSLLTEARVEDELVWDEDCMILRRGAGEEGAAKREKRSAPPAATAEWKLPGDLGRRYAAVSGDSNPIHTYAVTAKLLGFPRAIVQGLWTKARCLAALERGLPEAYTVDVEFRKPVLLPSRVGFGADGDRFAVTSGDTVHLVGEVKR